MPAVGQWGPQPFTNIRGRPIPGVTVTIFETDGTTPAALYNSQSGTVALANPLPIGVATTAAGVDVRGNGSFYAEPGPYIMAVSYGGSEVYRSNITVSTDDDTAGIGAGTVTSVTAGDTSMTIGGTAADPTVKATNPWPIYNQAGDTILGYAGEGDPIGQPGGVMIWRGDSAVPVQLDGPHIAFNSLGSAWLQDASAGNWASFGPVAVVFGSTNYVDFTVNSASRLLLHSTGINFFDQGAGIDGTDAPTTVVELADALVASGLLDSHTVLNPSPFQRYIALSTLVPTGHTRWNTYPSGVGAFDGPVQSDGAVDAAIWYDLALASGTWAINFAHNKSTNRGIYTFELAPLDALGAPGAYTTLGTIDGYAGAAVTEVGSLAGLAIATAGQYRLRVRMATKHASSSDFYGLFYVFILRLTLPL